MNAVASKPQMRNPEYWIGKRVSHLDWSAFSLHYSVCDYTGKFYRNDELHGFLYPVTREDWAVLDTLGLDIAAGYCQEVIDLMTEKANRMFPGWYDRHLEAA